MLPQPSAPHDPPDGSSAPRVRRAVDGEATERDWEELFARYRPKLVVYATRLLGPQLHKKCDPDDIVQQAWLEVVQRIGSFEYRGRGSLLAWLRIQVRRRVTDIARRPSVDDGDPAACVDAVAPDPGASSVMASSELRERLLATLDSLPSSYRNVVEARYIQGRPVVAIARAKGMKPDTVSQQIRRGLALWQRAFGSDPSTLLSA